MTFVKVRVRSCLTPLEEREGENETKVWKQWARCEFCLEVLGLP